MIEDELSALGDSYRKTVAAKCICYALAQRIAGRPLSIYKEGLTTVDQMDHLTNLEIGVMLAVDWGIDLPSSIMDKISVRPVRPKTQDLH